MTDLESLGALYYQLVCKSTIVSDVAAQTHTPMTLVSSPFCAWFLSMYPIEFPAHQP